MNTQKIFKFLALAALFLSVSLGVRAQNLSTLTGAWQLVNGTKIELAVLVDGYFSHTTYDRQNKEFISTRGGVATLQGNQLQIEWHYDTQKAKTKIAVESWLGTTSLFDVTPVANGYESNITGKSEIWVSVDRPSTDLTGVWRISGRKQGQEITTQPLRDRRTLKILTGNRFQWVAINIKTGEFSGTGGGTYSFRDGIYTENIEFFSRDATRVGASLSFDAKVVDDQWHHSGNSSSGTPIYEIWTKLGR